MEVPARVLKIPVVLAQKLCKGNRILFDELESAAGLQLAQILKSFDPNKHRHGKDALAGYAYTYCLKGCLQIRDRFYQRNLLFISFESLMEKDQGIADKLFPNEKAQAPDKRIIESELIERALSVLTETEREVIESFMRGEPALSFARQKKVTKSWIYFLKAQAMNKMRRALGG